MNQLQPSKLEKAFKDSTSKKNMLRRELSLKKDAINIEDRTVEIAFSSDVPYQRYDGFEILGHDLGEIVLDRLTNKAALLWNHNWDRQIGVVEKVEIDSKAGVGRAIVKFSQRADAQDFFLDVQDGIISKVSVGYMVHKWIDVSEEDDEIRSYRVISWEPYELSMVSIPADDTVGVGRSLETGEEKTPEAEDKNPDSLDPTYEEKQIQIKLKEKESKMDDEKKDALEKAEAAAKTNKAAGGQSEASRQKEIRGIGKNYNVKLDVMEEFLDNSEKTPADFSPPG